MTEKLPDGLSPGKRIQYRSECIDQLAFINERGVISVDEFKSIIMITLGYCLWKDTNISIKCQNVLISDKMVCQLD